MDLNNLLFYYCVVLYFETLHMVSLSSSHVDSDLLPVTAYRFNYYIIFVGKRKIPCQKGVEKLQYTVERALPGKDVL